MADKDAGKTEDRLMTDCQAAAFRAGRVHAWLDPLLRGSLAAKNAYTFKGRTKSADDIYKKVLGRRNHEDAKRRDPKYRPERVTDASGFRIVKLFNAEVPQSLDELLSLLKLMLAEAATSTGNRLADVAEIEFHTSRRLNDPLSIYEEVKKVVEDTHRLPLKPPEKDAPGQGPPSSYSSVHVLLKCEVRDGDKEFAAHSEIQLRSVFEEAWSEISHRLKYAPEKLARATGAVTPASDSDQLSDAHLNALKSLTDGCAQYADLINKQIKISATGRADRSEARPLDLADASAKMFERYGTAIQDAVKRAYKQRSEAVAQKDVGARAAGFRAAADLFQATMAIFKADRNEEDEQRFDVLREELAFCWMFSNNEELRSNAEEIYRELLEKRPERVSVLLRLGQLRRDAGALAEAATLMEDGLEAAKKNPEADQDVQRQANWLLRRDLAYIRWRMVDLEPHRTDAVVLLRRAIELSKEALKYVKTDEQFINSRQNYLDYVVDLSKMLPAGQRDALAATGKKLLDELRPKVDLNKWSIESLDTVARGEAAFGDLAKAKAAAEVVELKLGQRIAAIMKERKCNKGAAIELMSRDERNMYARARALLETLGIKGRRHGAALKRRRPAEDKGSAAKRRR